MNVWFVGTRVKEFHGDLRVIEEIGLLGFWHFCCLPPVGMVGGQ